MNNSDMTRVQPSVSLTMCAILFLGVMLPIVSAVADDNSGVTLQEVVVTAQRQAQSLLTIPESITSLDSATLSQLQVQSVSDLAGMLPDVSFQYGGGNEYSLGYGGSQVIAIRGISGENTTGLYIDDTPVPDTLDPQVLDLQRIEVLEGPQGTLYGEGSMGGNIRLVTVPPAFHNQLSYNITGGYTEHAATPDARTEVIGNLALIPDKAAVRAVGFISHEGGFMTREYPSGTGGQLASADNQGALTSYGGSITLLVKPASGLSITPRIMAEETNSHGLAFAFAPLPGFHANSFTRVRAANVQDGYQDKWYLPSLEVKDTIGRWSLDSSTSYFYRRLYNLEDGTEGTQENLAGPPYNAPPFIFAAGVGWPQWFTNSNFYQELRAIWSGNKYAHAIMGAFYANEITHWENGSSTLDFPLLVTTGTWPSPLLWDSTGDTSVRDVAGYGQMYLDMRRFELTLGARVFSLREGLQESDTGFVGLGPTEGPWQFTSQNGWTPKVALSYTADNGTMTYATASKGFRAGGNSPEAPVPLCNPGLAELGLTQSEVNRFGPDDVWNYEVGAKGRVGNVALTGSAFEMVWNQIQQNAVIPGCDFPFIANAGEARIPGVELQAFGQVIPGLQARLSLSYEDAKITRLGLSPQPVGSRVYGVPYVIGSLALTYTRQISEDVDGFMSTDYSYTGNSLSNTTTAGTGLPPAVRAGYGMLNAKLGAEWGQTRVWLYLRNITDVKANLGDVAALSYGQTDPTTGYPLPRIAVSRPFQVGIGFSHGM